MNKEWKNVSIFIISLLIVIFLIWIFFSDAGQDGYKKYENTYPQEILETKQIKDNFLNVE